MKFVDKSLDPQVLAPLAKRSREPKVRWTEVGSTRPRRTKPNFSLANFARQQINIFVIAKCSSANTPQGAPPGRYCSPLATAFLLGAHCA